MRFKAKNPDLSKVQCKSCVGRCTLFPCFHALYWKWSCPELIVGEGCSACVLWNRTPPRHRFVSLLHFCTLTLLPISWILLMKAKTLPLFIRKLRRMIHLMNSCPRYYFFRCKYYSSAFKRPKIIFILEIFIHKDHYWNRSAWLLGLAYMIVTYLFLVLVLNGNRRQRF